MSPLLISTKPCTGLRRRKKKGGGEGLLRVFFVCLGFFKGKKKTKHRTTHLKKVKTVFE